MVKKAFRNKFGLWTAVIYLLLVLFFGAISLGGAIVASYSLDSLFFVAIVPTIILILGINFLLGYGAGLLLQEIWGAIK